jgi:hypothetical protein
MRASLAPIVLPLLGATLLAAPDARALDAFEIQVYDGTANAPSAPGVELHVNRVFSGLKTATAPLLPADQQTHLTLEGSLGLLPWWELGAYLQTALRGDGTFDYAGVKLRSKFVTTERFDPRWRLGVNVEVANVPDKYDPDGWSMELRPIAAWENRRWIFAVNPIVGLPLAGAGWNDGPTFEPAAMAKVKVGEHVALGLEYYGDFGPIAHPRSGGAQTHYVFETFDLLEVGHFELDVGVGEGLSSASNAVVGKLILGYVFEHDEPAKNAALARLRRR